MRVPPGPATSGSSASTVLPHRDLLAPPSRTITRRTAPKSSPTWASASARATSAAPSRTACGDGAVPCRGLPRADPNWECASHSTGPSSACSAISSRVSRADCAVAARSRWNCPSRRWMPARARRGPRRGEHLEPRGVARHRPGRRPGGHNRRSRSRSGPQGHATRRSRCGATVPAVPPGPHRRARRRRTRRRRPRLVRIRPSAAQRAERLPHRHGRDPEALGEVALGGQRGAVGEEPEGDGVAEAARDGIRAPFGIERREDGGVRAELDRGTARDDRARSPMQPPLRPRRPANSDAGTGTRLHNGHAPECLRSKTYGPICFLRKPRGTRRPVPPERGETSS